MRTRDIEKEELVKRKAIELIVKEGLENFSVNKLAKACGISVATLYIYYKDKEDLILQICKEEAAKSGALMLENFDPEASFEEGLRQQWKNRARHMLANPELTSFFEQLRTSAYQQVVFETFREQFRDPFGKFMENAIARGEIKPMPFEVYWSVAFGPLYALLRFHVEGKSYGGERFQFNEGIMWQIFDYVIKGIKK